MDKKNFCNEDDCPLNKRAREIEVNLDLENLINKLLSFVIEHNSDIHPSCIKRFAAECIRNEAARIFVEAITQKKQSYRKSIANDI